MSRIGDLISGILGKEENTEETEKRPCRNCLPSCPYAPGACAECQPCKERLLDCIWNAEHEEEYLARYEIVPETDQTVGTETCPFCGGQNPVTAEVCDYCGSQLREPSGKIRVKSAAEIPSPILEAQDVIFERQAILKRYLSQTQKESTGLLDALHDLLTGTEDDGVSLGGKMTEEEIRATAAAYGVSVGTYLQGLDNGVCLTASAKKKEDEEKAAAASASAAAAASSAAPYTPVGYAAHPVRPEPVRPEPKRPGLGRPGQGHPGQGHPGQGHQGQGRPGRLERPGYPAPMQPGHTGRPEHPGNAGHSTNAGHNTNAAHSANAMHPGRPSAARPQQMQGKGPGRNARGGNRGGGSHR